MPSKFNNHDNRLINRRQIWAANRFCMEMNNLKSKRYGNKGHHHWYTLLFMMQTLKLTLKVFGSYNRGVRNAKNIVLREQDIFLKDLPDAFDNFTILHLSDLHFDCFEGITSRVHKLLNNHEVDICVFTGDYRTKLHGINKHIIAQLKELIAGIKSRNGFLGVLGNHDDCHMVNPLEAIGINMLVNSTTTIDKKGQQVLFLGTDDVHYYYTDQALHVLEPAEKEFSVALVHSPELFDVAAQMGVNLYLCGHTHAGQVCLPGGIPFVTHLNHGRKFYKGLWRHMDMQGYTHAGVGTSGIPVRFNTRGEVVIHRLKKLTQ